jgi:tripartite-type tricarboxylate transporter receptor subunit TctC
MLVDNPAEFFRFLCPVGETQAAGRLAMKRRLVAILLFASGLPATAADQIRLVVPFAAGGPVDLVARTIAGGLPSRLNAEVIIENRGGAGGVIGTELVAKVAPDGRTLLQASLGSHVLSAALRPQLNYDPIKSFTPIAFVGVVPTLLVVSTQSKINSLPELLAEARRKTMSYGSAGPGTTMNIAGELFASVTGIKTTHVPYRGAGPALNDLLGGHLDLIFADTPVLLPLVNSNAVRPLALFAAARSPLIPDVATTGQLGYPEVVMENWYGILAPAGLAPSMQATLEKAILDVLASPDVMERFAAGGLQGARDSAGFRVRLANDVAYWGPAVKKLGISPE